MVIRTVLPIAAAIAAVLASTTGCSSSTPPNPNIAACDTFARNANALVRDLNDGQHRLSDTTGVLQTAVNQIDAASMQATGDVKTRLSEFVQTINIAPIDFDMRAKGAATEQVSQSVQRACTTEGQSEQVSTFPTSLFGPN
ncbi:hypothetical protein ABIA39_008507 [Nocardia sp. GAS34]|uniref:hypothetical protein n=1 Tax=unclassified Nocardia TaxID=2637762 RepID=UPI003D19B798